MFNLTPAAATQILTAATAQPATPDQPDTQPSPPMLRVAAKVEEGEIVYGMGFDDEREHDTVIETNGVTLLIAPPSQALLEGATLDFVELRPGEFQFIFVNPNDPASGGCGPSQHGGGCGSCGSKGSSGRCGS